MKKKYNKPVYCYGCGAKEIRRKYIGGYDMYTGKPEYYEKYKCPNWRIWNFLFHAKGDTGGSYSY